MWNAGERVAIPRLRVSSKPGATVEAKMFRASWSRVFVAGMLAISTVGLCGGWAASYFRMFGVDHYSRDESAQGIVARRGQILIIWGGGVVGGEDVEQWNAAARNPDSAVSRSVFQEKNRPNALGLGLVRRRTSGCSSCQPIYRLWCPFSIPVVICGVVTYLYFRFIRKRTLAEREDRNICIHCSYDVRATPDRCPECGRSPRRPNRRLRNQTGQL